MSRFFLAVFLAAGSALAQQSLEIIPLHHRTVDQVLPVLQPLLEPGATLSGNRNQLFLRASPANADEIKRALEAIDRPARRLVISVRFDDAQTGERRQLGAQGVISTEGSRVRITAEDSRSSAAERVDQRLQVLEGSEATIFAGQDSGTGMRVRPSVAGERVVLDVAPENRDQRLVTTVTARLGEWVELGGTSGAANRDLRGIGSAGAARSSQSRRVWVKVEELPR